MVQATLDDTRKNDTANLFRADAVRLGTDADYDEYDENGHRKNPNRDRTVRGQKRQTSDQERLAERSGQIHSYGTSDSAQIEEREAATVRSVQQATIGGGTTIFGSLYQSAKSTVNEYLINPASEALASGRKMWNEYVYDPVAQAASDLKNWGAQKLDQAGAAISSKWTQAKDWTMSWFKEDAPAQQAPQALQQQAAAKPDAATQELSGAKNNPDAGLSLTSAWNSISDGVSSTFGFGTPTPTNAPKLGR